MKMQISLSVNYEDIGAKKPIKGRKRISMKPKRKVGYRKPSRPPKSQKERLARVVRNLRSQVKKRLDTVHLRKGTPDEINKARSEARTIYREYQRALKRLESLPK